MLTAIYRHYNCASTQVGTNQPMQSCQSPIARANCNHRHHASTSGVTFSRTMMMKKPEKMAVVTQNGVSPGVSLTSTSSQISSINSPKARNLSKINQTKGRKRTGRKLIMECICMPKQKKGECIVSMAHVDGGQLQWVQVDAKLTFAENNPSIRPIFPATRQDLELRGYVYIMCSTYSNAAALNPITPMKIGSDSSIPYRAYAPIVNPTYLGEKITII